MDLPLGELAVRIAAQLEGDPAVRIRGVAMLDAAGPGDLVYAESEALLPQALASPAAAVLLPDAAQLPPTGPAKPRLRCAVPKAAFARALALFHPTHLPEPGIHPSAVLARGVELGADVSIGPHAVLGEGARLGPRVVIGANCSVGAGVRIGADSHLFPNVTLYDGVTLGERVVVHAGTVIGADGYGYVLERGQHVKIPQVGTVDIGDDVEIGANATIDRATVGATRIGRGSKLDNLVQVAHNVTTGEGCLLAAQAGVSGSCRLGNFVTLAGQVGLGDHVTIEDGAIVAGQGGVPSGKRVSGGQVLWGTPARPLDEVKKQLGALGRLPDLLKHVRELLRRVKGLEAGSERSNDRTIE